MRTPSPFSPRRLVLACLATLVLVPAGAIAQLTRGAPASLTDAEFWHMFTTMSEPGGTFASENFVSNELTFQHVIPTLQRTVRGDGVYLGVGPEQNFTYIANLKPRLAIIFDIRRQNAMAHLMYKALFELSPTRGEFVSRLFSRPLTGRVATGARVDDMFAVASAAARSDSAFRANQRAVFSTLVDKHKFVLTPGDSAGIEHLMEVFYEAGPDINYGYRLGRTGTSYSTYPTYGHLQTLTNVDSVPMAFLATEGNYRVVRDMHLRNLIVPIVGDFAGPKAIRAVGEYLTQRRMTVQAYYLSNVEQYLWQNGVAERFYDNVATLPVDSTSMFIRSVPPGGGNMRGGFTFQQGPGGVALGRVNRMSISNMNGQRTFVVTQDSAGLSFTRTYVDSAGVLLLARADTTPAGSPAADSLAERRMRELMARQDSVLRGLRGPGALSAGGAPYAMARGPVIAGGGLVSGIASIQQTVANHKAGSVLGYRDIIAMTRLDGWK